jgi:hypothetical protein
MNQVLEKLIVLSCEALHLEDEYLREALSSNSCYSSDKNGLLCINNERYYQFVIARHLYAQLNMPIALESNSIDLVVYSDRNCNEYEVAIEMKRWMSSTGNPEIHGIREDFTKLEKTSARHGLMLIFSSAPKSVSNKENIEYLSRKLNKNVDPSRWFTSSFETVGINGAENMFYVSGYEVEKC